ncbi:uncharacterized protein DMENIID0001_137820 [Sergentomyia squamirostris]
MSIPRIIFDTDGGYDDAWALLMLLKAHRQKCVELVAIVCCSGNTDVDNSVINICRTLEVAGEKSIPVYRGAPDTILFVVDRKHDNFNGKDGFGDVWSPTKLPDMTAVNREEHGVNTLIRLIKQNPGELTLFAVGPLTNIALALRLYEDVAELLRETIIMGGNFQGIGNVTPSAEFNTLYDPEATDIVLKMLKCPTTVIPWETCIPPLSKLNWDWRKNVLGIVDHPVLHLLNPVEESNYKNLPLSYKWACADGIAAAVLLVPDLVVKTSENVYASVELNGSLTRGQWVLNRRNKTQNVKMITEIDSETYKKCLFWVVDKTAENTSLVDYLRAEC